MFHLEKALVETAELIARSGHCCLGRAAWSARRRTSIETGTRRAPALSISGFCSIL